MNALETLSVRTARLNKALAAASPAAVIEKAIEALPAGRVAIVSSFGTESAVLLKYVADVDPALPVLFLDTGMLFEETLDYRDRLVDFFGLTDVRSLKPQIELVERRDPDRDLWLRDTRQLLPYPQGPAAVGRARRLRRLDQWTQALSWRCPRQYRSCRERWAAAEIQSARGAHAQGHRAGVRGGALAAPSAGKDRLRLGRLHALHQPHP